LTCTPTRSGVWSVSVRLVGVCLSRHQRRCSVVTLSRTVCRRRCKSRVVSPRLTSSHLAGDQLCFLASVYSVTSRMFVTCRVLRGLERDSFVCLFFYVCTILLFYYIAKLAPVSWVIVLLFTYYYLLNRGSLQPTLHTVVSQQKIIVYCCRIGRNNPQQRNIRKHRLNRKYGYKILAEVKLAITKMILGLIEWMNEWMNEWIKAAVLWCSKRIKGEW